MTTIIYNSYSSLEETLNHLKCLKLKDHLGDNFVELCVSILVDDDHLESSGSFKPNHIGYTTHIFEYTSDSRFHLWATNKYM